MIKIERIYNSPGGNNSNFRILVDRLWPSSEQQPSPTEQTPSPQPVNIVKVTLVDKLSI